MKKGRDVDDENGKCYSLSQRGKPPLQVFAGSAGGIQMAANRHVDKIVYTAVAFAVILTVIMMNAEAFGITSNIRDPGYKKILFDDSRVHTIDLVVNDKEAFFADAEKHEYVSCSAVIDGDAANNIGLRVKGKTELGNVGEESRERLNLRLEFDHYQLGETWHGLDKLDLNNLIQDATCMKEYLTYSLMRDFGVPSPLASYAKVTLNGEELGLYLAVEGVEDSFISRNYGGGHAMLYRPENTESTEDARVIEAVKLKYTDDDPANYEALFVNAGTEPEPGDRKRLISLLKTLNKYEDLDQILDTEEVIRYFVVHNFTVSDDSYTGNTVGNYILLERDGRLAMLPWDYNTAYGSASGMKEKAAVNAPIDAPAPEGRMDDRPMVGWIFSDETYKDQYHELFEDFIEQYAESDRIREMISETEELIAPYVSADPTKFMSEEAFRAGVRALKLFVELRTQSVSGQLAGSIPSTYSGQIEDPESLVDASMLDLSALDSVHNTVLPEGTESSATDSGS